MNHNLGVQIGQYDIHVDTLTLRQAHGTWIYVGHVYVIEQLEDLTARLQGPQGPPGAGYPGPPGESGEQGPTGKVSRIEAKLLWNGDAIVLTRLLFLTIVTIYTTVDCSIEMSFIAPRMQSN